MSDLVHVFRVAWRGLARRPGFAIVAILALALGIGANTAIFSVVDAMLLKPLPFPEPQQLVKLVASRDGGKRTSPGVSGAAYLDWTEAKSFSAVAAMRGSPFSVSDANGAERIEGAITTRSFFDVLGTRPILGRTFARTPGEAREAVISDTLWRSRFGGAPDIIGRTITMDGATFTVVGVVRSAEAWPAKTDVWTATAMKVPEHPLRPQEDQSTIRNSRYLDVIARIAPGVTLAATQAELNVIEARLQATVTGSDVDGGKAIPMRDELIGDTRAQLLLLFGAVGLILLIACTNVAHLLLARALSRQQEIAIRIALGATRARLALLFFAESAILATAGGALGVTFALWASPLLVALGPSSMRAIPVAVDGRVLLFTAAVALLTAVVFGVVPALSAGSSPGGPLGDSARATAGGRRTRLRSTLVAVEVALSLVLLVGAGLLVRSFAAIASVNPGFQPAGAVTGDVWLPQQRYPTPEDRARFYAGVVEELASSPETAAAGAVSRLPLSSGNSSRSVTVAGKTDEFSADLRTATPGYLAAMKIPILVGRDFTAGDVSEAHRVVLVNDRFARMAWPDESPIGKVLSITLDDKPSEVVGLIGNVHHTGLENNERPEVYVPAAVDPWPFMTFVVRGRGTTEHLTDALRKAVASRDASLGLARVTTLEQRVDRSLEGRRFNMFILGGLAGLALLLALVGIYGVCAYSVSQRTRELGIRLALGARPRSLLGLVVGQSMRPVLIGLALGLAGSLGATRLMASVLFGVSATDPITYLVVPSVLALTAAIASFAAARKAATVEPLEALRAE